MPCSFSLKIEWIVLSLDACSVQPLNLALKTALVPNTTLHLCKLLMTHLNSLQVTHQGRIVIQFAKDLIE